MKITKRQLRRIIKEEKSRLLNEQSPLHMSGRNNDVMSQLHTAIDALIGALGNEEARQELLGIVEDWEGEGVYEGTSPDNMPSAWKQILKGTLT